MRGGLADIMRFKHVAGRDYPRAIETGDTLPETTYELGEFGRDDAGPDEPFMVYVRAMMYQPEHLPTADVVRRTPAVTIDPYKYSKPLVHRYDQSGGVGPQGYLEGKGRY